MIKIIRKTYEDSYIGRLKMDKDIKGMQKKGWTVKSIEEVGQGYSASKTCCLGCAFLPLALLGRKSNKIVVIYEKNE